MKDVCIEIWGKFYVQTIVEFYLTTNIGTYAKKIQI
jgi:hypothetical protein